MPAPDIKVFWHKPTGTCCYVVACPNSKECLVIDPVIDFKVNSGATSDTHAETVFSHIKDNGLTCKYIIETHVHADHLTGAALLKHKLAAVNQNPQVIIGEGVVKVQETWKPKLNLPWLKTDGSQFEILAKHNQQWKLGELTVKCLFTPGHTPDSCSYLIEDALFPGDTVFMPDAGTARCDFPNGSAELLYTSITEQLFTLPDATRVFVCHDYELGGKREFQYQTTIGEQKAKNVSIGGKTKEEYVKVRSERDATLDVPGLLFPSIQVNLLNGNYPPAEDNGTSFLKIPLSKCF
eukprot:NODE_980_length_1077_cov_127.980000_g936_i0.p1 GENE.NODE_980_length_1077_cov_127.980000_g936_i0~~NODE_980_length_1077_cov_127.980000_g936_i0.p1  ORF type:complete len:294 (-),score=64.11 NODE_980_length_1077_cov_127.980000_g936_i0:115-996(-)